MIRLGPLTRLTTEAERMFVQLGGGDPDRTYTEGELGDRLAAAVDQLPPGHPILTVLADELLDQDDGTAGCDSSPGERNAATAPGHSNHEATT